MGPADPGTAAGPRRRPGTVARLVIVAVLVVLALAGAFVAGRATAPGPAVVVVPGAIAEQEPERQPLPLVVPAEGPSWPVLLVPGPGLPDEPTTASGYRLVTGGLDGGQVAAELAAAWGVPGEVRAFNEGWIVGGGGDPALEVRDDAYLSWTLSGAGPSGADVRPPSAERARELAADLLGRIGVDVDTVDWQVERYDDRMLVTAWQVIGPSRTGLAWTVGLGDAGAVLQASGFAAGLQEVPGYPVVGATTAVRRATLPTWSVVGPRPVAAPGSDDAAVAPGATGPASPVPTPPAGPDDRPVLAVPMSEITATEAELGVAQFRQPDGSVLLLPSYLLTGADGSRWTLLAVTGDYVAFVDVPYPSPTPTDG